MKSPESKMNISLNFINLMFYAGIACISPFLSVHATSIGLTSWQLVVAHAASGLLSLAVPLAVCFLAEKPRRHRYRLCFSVALGAATAAYAALLAVPRVVRVPRQPLLDFDCSSPLSAVVNVERCANWASCAEVAAAWSTEALFRLSHCRFKDSPPDISLQQADQQQFRNASPPLHVCFRSAEDTTNLCLVHDLHVRENAVLEFRSDLRPWHYTEFRNVSVAEFLAPDPRSPPLSVDICSFRPATGATVILVNDRRHDSVFCRPTAVDDSKGVRCLLSISGGGGRTSPCYEVVGDPSFTFWLYLGLRAVADSFFLAAVCLLEGISLRVIQSGPYHRGAYGRTRLWPALALMAIPIPAGALVDYYTGFSGQADYSPAYFVFAGFELVACALIFALPLPVGGNTVRYTVSPHQPNRIHDPEWQPWPTLRVVTTAVMAVFLGSAWGISQVFDPLLYQSLGFNHLMLGSTQAVAILCAVPFLCVSKILLQNIGDSNLLSAGFAFHAIHLAGLSFVGEWGRIWWAVPFEAMRAFALPVAWLALVASAEHGNGKGRRIALQYLLVQMHFGAGRMIGCLAGGLLSEYFSMSLAYRAASAFCLFMAFFYLLFHHLFLKPRYKKNLAARRSTQRLSVNGSCLQLVDRRPLNGGRQMQQNCS